MELIDILTPDNDNLPKFTVDTTVKYVSVSSIAGLGCELSCADVARKKFSRGDNLIILSCGYFIPERFSVFDYPDGSGNKYSSPIMGLFGTWGATQFGINTFGNRGLLKVPFPNYEFSLGTFVDTELNSLTDGTFKLVMAFPYIPTSIRISMIDVPVALNGEVINIIPFVKILHNLELSV